MQALALHMKAHPAWAGRAVTTPRSRKAVRESAGLDGTDKPQAIMATRNALTLSV